MGWLFLFSTQNNFQGGVMLTNIKLQKPVKIFAGTSNSFCPAKIQGCPHENPECSKSYECKLDFIHFPRCERCGSSREKIDRGVCKGILKNEDGTTQMCFLRW